MTTRIHPSMQARTLILGLFIGLNHYTRNLLQPTRYLTNLDGKPYQNGQEIRRVS